MIEDLRNAEFWVTLVIGLISLGFFIRWLRTGGRVLVQSSPTAKTWDISGGPMLKEGSHAPEFSVLDDRGRKVSLTDYRGKKHVVLFFYPKADTPG